MQEILIIFESLLTPMFVIHKLTYFYASSFCYVLFFQLIPVMFFVNLRQSQQTKCAQDNCIFIMKYACTINFQRQKPHHLSQSDCVKTKGIVIIEANFVCKTSFPRTSLSYVCQLQLSKSIQCRKSSCGLLRIVSDEESTERVNEVFYQQSIFINAN